ncbi:MATE family efflux transporter [bacterium]|nr:MATE family efflux transporter [bacterium]
MNTKELTYGNPLKLILVFMFPLFLGNLFQQFYNFTDALIVGRVIGIKSLAAIGVTGPLIFLVISFIFASTQGFTIILAQRFGARDYIGVRKSLAASLILAFLMTVLLTVFSTPFSKFFLMWLQTPSDIIEDAAKYLFIMFIGIFATVYYNLSSNVIRALGNSKTPLYFLIFSVILNIFFDILFVVKFHWGIQGAGWATVLAQAISTVVSVTYMFLKFPVLHLKKEDWKFSKEFLYEHLRYGIPMGIQMSILTLGMIAVQYVLNSFGSTAVAAFTTAMRVDQMFSQVFMALGATMSVFAAQNFGAKKMSRIRDGAKSAVLIALFISGFSFIILKLFGANIISLFMTYPDNEVIRLGMIYLNIIIIFFIFLGLLMIFRNILQGMGDVMSPLLSGVAELIARASFAFLFGHYFGYIGVCTATPAAWISGTLVLFISYRINIKRFAKLKR